MNRTTLVATAAAVVLTAAACTQTIDAGSSRPHGRLPVDERNPVVLTNDGIDDNWQGEYAVLLANSGALKLDAIIVSTSPGWANIEANITGWRALVAAARMSGLRNIPDPIASTGQPLTRPADGAIDKTAANRSEGAHHIVEASHRLGLSYRPLVVVTGGRLTDVADAYLIDPTVVDRVVVVSALGMTTSSGGSMGIPNGEMDPWAEMIVAARFRYVQVSAYYDQLTDLPASRVAELPANAFGAWMAAKQTKIWAVPLAADQVAVAALCLPEFTLAVDRVSPARLIEPGATAGPDLVSDPDGRGWLVTESMGAVATDRLWELLGDTAASSSL
jgi:hypothetical protein